ncbi:uncharacterized protein Tco025E_06855 [Trypanosoma conorhini]|uniref:UTP23 sensor motif region domain-containing protein n=1 Tax=Trypanosoma conorhini TaxID=83891 RepID=A0A3R7KUK5_9TRYP|nr:uncharacterized protein Tco025E_06855 [Trypanosoma conorhini]RNF10020.1 hypothetical protein Tco025E_06855 [Trypanosoma conorhini]
MKRRVLRAHANKRRLRLLSAEHGLRLDAYSILCDASFLRALMLATGASDRSPARALKALMYETFAAATAHVSKEAEAGAEAGSAAGAPQVRRPKDLTLALYYLPETATSLRRMAQQRLAGWETASAPRKQKERNEGSATTPAVRDERRTPLSMVESLLAGLECAGGEAAATGRNEAKAIAQFLAAAGSVESRIPHAAQERKNAHFFFVATQSHDVRRLLPRSAALIRLTTSPTALWIERNGDAFHYGEEGAANSTPRQESAAAAGGKVLSAADVAFMRHLSADLVPAAGANKRRRSETSNAAAAKMPDTTAAPQPKAAPMTGHKSSMRRGNATRSRRKAVGGPNPLAVKKKRVREVFRVDLGASKKPK